MAETLVELFLASASDFADKPAIIDGESTISFRQYAGAALSVAAAVERRGEGERVAILLPTSDAFAIAFFGVMLSGRVPVPLNFFLTTEEISHILADSGVKTVVTTAFFQQTLAALPVETLLAERFIPEAVSHGPGRPAAPNAVAAVIYTSGTTGMPKGAVLSHRNIIANVRGCVEHFRFDPSHRLLGVLPFFHAFALTTTLALPAAIGATSVVMRRFEPAAALGAFARYGITTCVAVPSMFRALVKSLDRGNADLSSARLLISGGEPLGEGLGELYAERFGLDIYEGYGLTEASPVVCANTPLASRAGTVGRPLPNVEVRVAGPGGGDAGVDADGDIQVRGDSVMEGYHNLPDETRAVMTGDGFLRTGDIGRMDGEGFIRITGRRKDMIISAGENVFPGEIERVLARHPSVLEAAVVGVPDAMRGEAPKAFVVLKNGCPADAEHIRDFCRASLARYKVPSEIEFVAEFPHGPTGKILKKKLARTAPLKEARA